MAMITITFQPATPAQAELVGKLMGQYLQASQTNPEWQHNGVEGLAEAAQAVAAVAEEKPAAKKSRVAKAAANAEAPTQDSSAGASTPASTATTASPSDLGNDTPAATSTASPTASNASSSEPAVSLEQVRAKLASLSQAGKAAQVKGLIAQFGVAKLTDVPADKYGQLMQEAEAL